MTPRSTSPGRWLVATTEYADLTPYTGGIGRHFAALLPGLVANGAEVDLLVCADDLRANADLHGVRLLDTLRRAPASPIAADRRFAGAVRDAYAHGRYDRIFVPEWRALGVGLPRSAPLLTNLATSIRLAHEVSGLRRRDLPLDQRIPTTVQRMREERQIRRSAGLIAISTAMLDRTRAHIPRMPPAAVVPNCIDVEAVAAAARTAPLPQGWPRTNDPIVLFLGRSERRKGVTDAVSAFATLHERIPSAWLVLAGAGGDPRFEPTRAQLSALLPPSARERVVWLGHVAGDELYRGIAAASVAICPSRWEGFGQVALEAKAAGTPVVVTSGSGFDDFCTDDEDCLMVAPGDPSALARAVERLLSDGRHAARLAAEARVRVEEFAPVPVATRLIDAADRLLGPARRAN